MMNRPAARIREDFRRQCGRFDRAGSSQGPISAAAAIDRLVHHSVIVELNIPSCRLDAAKRSQQVAMADSTS